MTFNANQARQNSLSYQEKTVNGILNDIEHLSRTTGGRRLIRHEAPTDSDIKKLEDLGFTCYKFKEGTSHFSLQISW